MTKKLISAFLAVLMLVGTLVFTGKAAEAEMPFKDVGEKKWFYDEVLYVYERGLMTGTTDTKFEPNGKLTRAMFVTILGRLAGATETETDAFSDIKKKTWFSGYVGWAVEAGIVTGYEDCTFKPNKALSREEMAACISRYVDFMGIQMPRENTAPDRFADVGKVAKWAREYVEMLRRAGIVNGDQNEKYNPKANITRAEMATIIMNLIGAEEKAWQGYVPNAETDDYAVYGAKFLFTSGFGLQGAMEPLLEENDDYPYIHPVMDERGTMLSYDDDDSVGFSPTAVIADLRKTPYVKICYKYVGSDEPANLSAYISRRHTDITSREDIVFEKTASDGMWSTAVFNATPELLERIQADFGREQGTNIHIMLKPYVGAADGAEFRLAYVGLFPTAESATSFKLEDKADYFKNYYRYSATTMEEINEDKVDEYLAEVRERIAEIKAAPSAVTAEEFLAAGKKVYYVSSINGDDSNDGLSPETPFKSVNALWRVLAGGKVWDSNPKAGDLVLFERGSEFYPSRYYNNMCSTLHGEPGVTYGAYGEGEKPRFYGSYNFGGGTGEWSETEWENIYCFDAKDYLMKNDFAGDPKAEEKAAHFTGSEQDVGSIIFNEGEFIGIKVFPDDPSDPFGEGKTTRYMGKLGTCAEYYISGGTSCLDPGDALRNNLEYIHDFSTGKIYLRCNDGNPEDIFDRIDVTKSCFIVYATDNVRYDNLACLYTSWIAIDLGDNNVVTNCEAGYAGGCTASVGTGIGGFGACESMIVNNCYIHDIEDGPMGTQETTDYTQRPEDIPELNGVVLTDNVITTSKDIVELFSTCRIADEDGVLGRNKICDAVVKNNYGVYMGYGYPKTTDFGGEALILMNYYYGEMVNCVFEDNTVIGCHGGIIGAHVASDGNDRGWFTYGNTYIINPDFCDILRGGDGMVYTNLNMSFYASFDAAMQYKMRNLIYLTSIGVETTSNFYFYDNKTEGEANGYFFTTGWHIERGNKPL